jgi:hypothetical protein
LPSLRLMTTQETADYLSRVGVQTSARTLEAWRREGKGPDYLRVQGRVRYRPSTVREWIVQDEHKSTGTAAWRHAGEPPSHRRGM